MTSRSGSHGPPGNSDRSSTVKPLCSNSTPHARQQERQVVHNERRPDEGVAQRIAALNVRATHQWSDHTDGK